MNLSKICAISILSAAVVLSSSCEHLKEFQAALAALNNKSTSDSYAESDSSYSDSSYSDSSYSDSSYSDSSYSDSSSSDSSYADSSYSDSSGSAAAYSNTTVWTGVCHNSTVNVNSPVVITMHQHGRSIHGSIKLDHSRLVCAPHFRGSVKYERFTFVTPPYGGHGKIVWTGIFENGYMRGVYVTDSGQKGTILLRRRR